jgi:tetratricopeptide (TPR) repeat protein
MQPTRIPLLLTMALLAVPALAAGPATQPDAKSVELYPDPITRLARLGKYDDAIKLGKATLAKIPAGAEGNVDRANAVAALAGVYATTARYNEAKDILAGVAKLVEKDDQADALALANLYAAQGDLAYEMGDYDAATSLAAKTLELRKKYLAADDLLIADANEDLAMASVQDDKPDGAEAMLAKVLRIRRSKSGNETLMTADTYSSMGFYYLNIDGDPEKAVVAYQKSLDIRTKLLGDKHLDIADSLYGLAQVDVFKERPDDAINKLNKARTIIIEVMTKDHPYVAYTDETLATLYSEAGENKKAADLIQEAVTICEKSFGDDHSFYADAIEQQAKLVTRASPPAS